MFRGLLRTLFGLRRAFRGPAHAPAPAAPADPRAADPWLAGILSALGDRYQLAADHFVTGVYEARGHGDAGADDARKLLSDKIDGPLAERGLLPCGDKIEDWGGTVVIRRYQGRCDDAQAAARAVRFLCQESDQIMDTAAE